MIRSRRTARAASAGSARFSNRSRRTRSSRRSRSLRSPCRWPQSDAVTEEEERQERIRFETQARRDIQDIRALQEFPAFQRYFMRRLVQKRDEIAGAFRNAEPFV